MNVEESFWRVCIAKSLGRVALTFLLQCCDIEVNGFKFQSSYYIHFQTIIFWKVMNSLIPHRSYRLKVPILFFYKEGFIPLNQVTEAETEHQR